MTCYYKGTLVISHRGREVVMKNCLYIPNAVTLISVDQLTALGMIVVFDIHKVQFFKNRTDLLKNKPYLTSGRKCGERLWTITVQANPEHKRIKNHKAYLTNITQDCDANVLHRRLGHRSLSYLQKLVPALKNAAPLKPCISCISMQERKAYKKKYVSKDGIPIGIPPIEDFDPDAFAQAYFNINKEKPHSDSPKKEKSEQCFNGDCEESEKRYGRFMSSDTKVLLNYPSIRGYKYLFILHCRDTGVGTVFLGIDKNDYSEDMKIWLREYYNKYRCFPEIWKFDSGTEFFNHDVIEYLRKCGTKFYKSNTKASNQNAHAERRISVLWKGVLLSLAESGVPFHFWCYCVTYMQFILNHLPHRGHSYAVPLEKAKMKTMYNLLLTYGCEIWYSIPGIYAPDHTRRLRGVMLGISDLTLGYDILDIATGKIVQSRDIVAREENMPFKNGMDPCRINLDYDSLPPHTTVESTSMDQNDVYINTPQVTNEDDSVDISDPPRVDEPQDESERISPSQAPVPEDWEGEMTPIPFTRDKSTPDIMEPDFLDDVQETYIQSTIKDINNTITTNDKIIPSNINNELEEASQEPETNEFDEDTKHEKQITDHDTTSTTDEHTNTDIQDLPTTFPEWKEDQLTSTNKNTNSNIHKPNIQNFIETGNGGDTRTKEAKKVSFNLPSINENNPLNITDEELHIPLRKKQLHLNFGNKPSKKLTPSTPKGKNKRGRGRPPKSGKHFFFDTNSTTPIPKMMKGKPKDNKPAMFWEPLKIIDVRKQKLYTSNDGCEYKVVWKPTGDPGGDLEETWEPLQSLSHSRKTLNEFKKSIAGTEKEVLMEKLLLERRKQKAFFRGQAYKAPKLNQQGTLLNPIPEEVIATTPPDDLEAPGFIPRMNTHQPISETYEAYEASEMYKPFKLPPRYEEHVHFTPENISLEDCIDMSFNAIQELLRDEPLTVPKHRHEAQKHRHWDDFKKAEIKELEGIAAHGTFKEVICPPDRTPITCRWVYDIKRKKNGEIDRFKARLVVQGFKQREGIDFQKTFSSTTQIRTFRVFVATAIQHDWEITAYDISNAYLNAPMDTELYMKWPPGYPSENKDTVIQLIKGLYGTRQSGRLWQQCLYEALRELGFAVCKTESGVVHRSTDNGPFVIISFVDDLCIGTSKKNRDLKNKVVELLCQKFTVKCLGILDLYIGIGVDWGTHLGLRTVYLHQEQYWKNCVQKYLDKDDIKTAKVPATPNQRLTKLDCPITDEEKSEIDYPYINVTGTVLYGAICTRPDIMFATSNLCRFNANPGHEHVKASKVLLRYLKGTSGDGIRYTQDKNFHSVINGGKMRIQVYVDSDWAGCPDTRRSTMGYVIKISNGPVSWKSRLMPMVAQSSCEAEFMALAEVCREVMWICRFYDEIGISYHIPEIFCDSQSAIAWSEDPIQHQRNKHIEIKYYYCRDLVTENCVRLFYVITGKQQADPQTKPVGPQVMNNLKPDFMGWNQKGNTE
jgi:hypothetical protein